MAAKKIDKILVINSGSSSLKFTLFNVSTKTALAKGLVERVGTPNANLVYQRNDEPKITQGIAAENHGKALAMACKMLTDPETGVIKSLKEVNAIGHRVVHGAEEFSDSVLITEDVKTSIKRCADLAPLHNPANLDGVVACETVFPNTPNVAVFDTAFHQTMPPVAYTYPVPHEWLEAHSVRRYGFHGTSHRFVAKQALHLTGLSPEKHRLVTAHLGNGCSCAAVRDGKSVDTTMGLTPLEGVMMGTRSGSVDPAIIDHVAKALGKPEREILDALNKKSGLLGVSGLSNDMRTIEDAAARGHERARLAFDIFCYVLAKSLAALVVPLGHLDALVFTGGIGENSVAVRARTVEHLGFLGLTIDPHANATHGRSQNGRITEEIRPQALVVPTNEELMIAQDTAEIARRR